jgi:hypothetical protein
MAKQTSIPDDVQLASMQKGPGQTYQMMQPGSGTPWEDRGALGSVSAFFKTVTQSMFSPGKLLAEIRRPETASDARAFVIICAVFWGVTWVVHDLIAVHAPGSEQMKKGEGLVDYYPVLILHFALGAGGAFFLHLLISRLFYKLSQAGDAKIKAPPVLTYNVFAYCMGPSILCLIPFYIGPLVALAWIFCLFLYAAIARLAIKTSGAITCTIISFGGLVGGAIVAYRLINWALGGVSSLLDF